MPSSLVTSAAAASNNPSPSSAPPPSVGDPKQQNHQHQAMEVEVKLRLPDRAAYDKAAALWASGGQQPPVATYEQENYFFDGSGQELSSRRVVLRLRFYNGNAKAVVTIKGKAVLKDGIGTASEVEAQVEDPVAARAWLDDPSRLLGQPLDILAELKASTGVQALVCLGGFRNHRTVYDWCGLTLELDETRYEWGTTYEIECETRQPEAARAQLEAALGAAGISYTYSQATKFANFRNRTLE